MLFSFFIIAVIVTLACANKLQAPEKFVHAGQTYESKKAFIESGKRCRTKDLTEAEMEEVEKVLARDAAINEKKKNKITVQVYWNMIKNTNGDGEISSTDIDAQIQVLNDAYAPTAKFVLADTITTVSNTYYSASIGSNAESNMKSALRQGDASDLNIYSNAQTDGTLGWATFPNWYKGDPDMDGIVLDYRTLPGGSFAPYNEGATLTHEAGHWMGLYHTFQGGCQQSNSKGDKVSDTPAVASPNFGCPSESTNSCPGKKGGLKGNDMVHNYMDYVDDDCMWEFTKGQRSRMQSMWNSYRK
jgi:hypothetical protein